jgi:hypothetical protein
MANWTEREDLNYLGILYNIGANQTPFLNLIGGIENSLTCKSFNFPVAQTWTLAANQTGVTEDASVAGQTPLTTTKAQAYNTVQIYQRAYAVSYAKQSAYGEIAGLSIQGENVVTDELEFQKQAKLKQIAVDIEYNFLNSDYVNPANGATAGVTRGLKYAITTNTVAGGAVALTKAMLDEVLKEMATSGAQFSDKMVILCNAFQKQAISNLLSYVPMSRNVGGVNIDTVETDFGMFGVQYCPKMPTDEVYLVDASVCKPMILPVDGQLLIVEEKAYAGAAKGGQVYIQIGLDYGPEQFHGSITGLKNA